MAGFGAFGKMPALGDFFRLGVAPDVVPPWDAWLRLSTMAPVACIPWVLAEQTLPPPARLHRDAPARLTAMREVARRHRDAVMCQDAAAVRHCAARLLVKEAEHGTRAN